METVVRTMAGVDQGSKTRIFCCGGADDHNVADADPLPVGRSRMPALIERLRAFRGERGDQRDAELSCRDVFRASPHPIDCIGPALLGEAGAAHDGAWKS